MNVIRHILDSHPFNVIAHIEGSIISFDVGINVSESSLLTVNLDEVVEKYSQDHGCIAIGKKDNSAFVLETTAITLYYRGSPFVDTHGTARRDTPLSVYRGAIGEQSYPVGYLMTPFKGCSLSDCTFYSFGSSNIKDIPVSEGAVVPEGQATTTGNVVFTVNGVSLDTPSVDLTPTWLNNWLPITLTGPASVATGEKASYTVNAPVGTTVYLEGIVGSIDRTRAVNGDIITFSAGSLPAGTTGRIKAGYKYWEGSSNTEIAIV